MLQAIHAQFSGMIHAIPNWPDALPALYWKATHSGSFRLSPMEVSEQDRTLQFSLQFCRRRDRERMPSDRAIQISMAPTVNLRQGANP